MTPKKSKTNWTAIIALIITVIGLLILYINLKVENEVCKKMYDQYKAKIEDNNLRLEKLVYYLRNEHQISIEELSPYILFDQLDIDIIQSKYSFEQGTENWERQTYDDSQACIRVSQSNENSYEGRFSLKMDMDLIGNDSHKSKGEALVNISNPINLNNDTVSIWVYAPQEAKGKSNNPNGFQVFVKDENYNCEYGPWHHVKAGIWNEIILIVSPTEPRGGYMQTGFNPERITTIGFKMGTGKNSSTTFEGSIYIDAVNW